MWDPFLLSQVCFSESGLFECSIFQRTSHFYSLSLVEITTLSDRIRFLHLEFLACTLLPDTSTVYFFVPRLYTFSYPDCILPPWLYTSWHLDYVIPHILTVYFLTPQLYTSYPNCILPDTGLCTSSYPDYILFVVSIVWSFFILLKIKLCSLIKVSTCVSSIKLSKAKGKIELCGSNWEGSKILKMCKSREPKPRLPVHI